MNIYKIVTNEKYVDYDTYDSAVVVAHSEDEARTVTEKSNGNHLFWDEPVSDLEVTLVGVADKSIKEPTVLVASFNAG